MAHSIQIATIHVGALNNGLRPGFKIPSGYGGITVLAAQIFQAAAGTAAFNLVDLGTAGTAVSGTIATLGSAVFVANTPQDLTVSTAYVAEGRYVGVEETNVGTGNAVTECYVEFLNAK
ncbi:MAG: hypothetical protein HY689_02960 [Chloroflexi bacterium]|nr:hypothetical protein [Chloroflexota bacterium]